MSSENAEHLLRTVTREEQSGDDSKRSVSVRRETAQNPFHGTSPVLSQITSCGRQQNRCQDEATEPSRSVAGPVVERYPSQRRTTTMERKNASDFDQELLNLFDQYVHGAIDRRGFLDRATKFAVGGVTAAMLLDALNPRFAEAQQVPKDDKRLKTEYLEFESPQGNGKMRGY